jgi:hypothetical protein
MYRSVGVFLLSLHGLIRAKDELDDLPATAAPLYDATGSIVAFVPRRDASQPGKNGARETGVSSKKNRSQDRT